jgi:hypothetical protein
MICDSVMFYTAYLLFLAIRSRNWRTSVREGFNGPATGTAGPNNEKPSGYPAAGVPAQPGQPQTVYPPQGHPVSAPGTAYTGTSPAPAAGHPGYGQV